MAKSPRRPGPFAWQFKLRIKRLDRLWDALVARSAPIADPAIQAPMPPSAVEIVAQRALKAARLALLSHNNCLITDRPDFPRTADSGWTTDFSRELALIDAALDLVPTTGGLPDVVMTAFPRRVLPPYLGNDDAVQFAGLGSGWRLRAAPSKFLAKLPPDGALPRPVDEP